MRRNLPSVVAMTAAVAAIFAGCGGSSKPAYCGNIKTLEQSVKSIDPTAGLDAVKTQVGQVAGDAANVISSAKSDFPDQTAAIESSLSKLQADIKALTSSPTPQGIVSLGSEAKAFVESVDKFVTDSKSKCS